MIPGYIERFRETSSNISESETTRRGRFEIPNNGRFPELESK